MGKVFSNKRYRVFDSLHYFCLLFNLFCLHTIQCIISYMFLILWNTYRYMVVKKNRDSCSVIQYNRTVQYSFINIIISFTSFTDNEIRIRWGNYFSLLSITVDSCKLMVLRLRFLVKLSHILHKSRNGIYDATDVFF